MSARGLTNASEEERRVTVCCIHGARAVSALQEKALVDLLAYKTPQEAHALLSNPDVAVTNQSDKEEQLPKLMQLNELAARVFGTVSLPIASPLMASGGVAAMPAGAPTGHPIFLSLRFGEAMQEAAELQRQLEARGTRAFICDELAGANLLSVIASALDSCALAVILASETYGRETNNLFDTSKELAFVISEKKPVRRPARPRFYSPSRA